MTSRIAALDLSHDTIDAQIVSNFRRSALPKTFYKQLGDAHKGAVSLVINSIIIIIMLCHIWFELDFMLI